MLAIHSTGVIVNGEGNILETQGNIGTFKVSGDEKRILSPSAMRWNEFSEGSGLVDIEINGSENRSIGGS